MQKQNSLLSKKRSKDKPLRKKSSKNIKIKGPWTPHEDQLLMKWIQNHGPKNWARCAETIKGRNGKQCREHWNNSLNYNIVKGQWSTEEDLFIMVFYDKLDKSWKKMIPLFKSRTENAIKNRFFSQLRKITAKFVKKDKNEYNSKFKLGILIKYYDKGVEEAKNDFLKEHPMTEDNYKSFIKDIENLINNKPKEQKYIDLENVEKKYFLNSNHAVINNVNNNNEKKEEDKNNENEININIDIKKELDTVDINKENKNKENENKENINKENKENEEDNNNEDNEEFDDDKDSISITDYENRKAEGKIYLEIHNDDKEKTNNVNNIKKDFKRFNEVNKFENKNINMNGNGTAFYPNTSNNKTVANNILELQRNLSKDVNNSIISPNPNINNYNNNNFGCNNYFYNINYNNNNILTNNTTYNSIKENNNNISNINNFAYNNNIVNNKIIINNEPTNNIKTEPNYPIYMKKPSDINEYIRNNAFTNYNFGRGGNFPDGLESPFFRYNSNSIYDFNNIYGANNMNNMNNSYVGYYRPMNNNNDIFNFDKANYFMSKDSGALNSVFKRSDSTDNKNLNKINNPFTSYGYGYRKSTSFGSIKDGKIFENFNNDEISKQ